MRRIAANIAKLPELLRKPKLLMHNCERTGDPRTSAVGDRWGTFTVDVAGEQFGCGFAHQRRQRDTTASGSLSTRTCGLLLQALGLTGPRPGAKRPMADRRCRHQRPQGIAIALEQPPDTVDVRWMLAARPA